MPRLPLPSAAIFARQEPSQDDLDVLTSFVTIVPTPTATPDITSIPGAGYAFLLSTSVTIEDIPTQAPTPYQVQYAHFKDGSLVTPLFINDFVADKTRLVVLGLLAMLFGRNVAVAASYIRRVQLKHKMLFYFLLISQLCGVLAVTAELVPFFYASASCTVVNILTAVSVELSFTLLIPGILGVKAYRYLDRSRFILITLSLLHLAALALFFTDLPKLTTYRKLTGSCMGSGEMKHTFISIMVQAFEIVFISLCFVYAVWRGSRYPEARGRMSIRLSVSKILSGIEKVGDESGERGWWDYVPHRKNSLGKESTDSRVPEPQKPGPFVRLLMRLFGDHDLLDKPYIQRKCLGSESSSAAGDKSAKRMSWRNWSRMFKLPTALKDELVYITVIAITCIPAIALIVIGAFNSEIMGGPSTWAGISWGGVSLVIMHSFSRVVRRNEREAILREPSAWNPLYDGDGMRPKAFTPRRTPFSAREPSVLPDAQRKRYTRFEEPVRGARGTNEESDPFSDSAYLRGRPRSWEVETIDGRSMLDRRSNIYASSRRSSLSQIIPTDVRDSEIIMGYGRASTWTMDNSVR